MSAQFRQVSILLQKSKRGINFDGPRSRVFSRPMIEFRDPDGLRLEITAVDGLERDKFRADRPRCCAIDWRVWGRHVTCELNLRRSSNSAARH